MSFPEDPYTEEQIFGNREPCDDEAWEDEEDYEEIEVSAEDYEKRRRIA